MDNVRSTAHPTSPRTQNPSAEPDSSLMTYHRRWDSTLSLMPQEMNIIERTAAPPGPDAQAADRVLAACLDDPRVEAANQILGDLIEIHIQPLVERVVANRMRTSSTAQREDIVSDALVSFLLHIEDLRNGKHAPIQNVSAFAHTLAARACSDHFRRMHPAFHSLRNKLRYILETYPELARWKDPHSNEWVCGLVAWQTTGARPRTLPDDAPIANVAHPADQLLQLFRAVSAPIRFDQLVQRMALEWNVQELVQPAPQPHPDNPEEFETIDSAPPVGMTIERRQWLMHLWKQIADLNLNQRTALLLNLKNLDGSSAATLFVFTGIASLRQMASLLEMPPAQFAELWPRLPLGDLELGSLLQLTRQQVINLRKCARERLARHMKIADRRKW
jgi:DNA-directed RNA polymerase specialized sigma24 family protein